MEKKLTLSNNFPFVYSLVKCFYSSENIFLRNFEIKQVKGIDTPVSSNDILCLPVTTIDKASIYLIDFLLINAKKQKSFWLHSGCMLTASQGNRKKLIKNAQILVQGSHATEAAELRRL